MYFFHNLLQISPLESQMQPFPTCKDRVDRQGTAKLHNATAVPRRGRLNMPQFN